MLHRLLPFAFIATGAVAASVTISAPLRFGFGNAAAAPGFVAISTTTQYSDASVAGFEPDARVEVTAGPIGLGGAAPRSAVTASTPFSFSVRLPEANYRVTVTLGDPNAASITTVKAETRRLMLERVRTAPGEFVRRSFLVNVRQPRLSDGSSVSLDPREWDAAQQKAIASHWDEKLTLTFSDAHPAVAAIEIERVEGATTLFLTGDSTVTDQPHGPAASWGQMVPRWFNDSVAIANHAESGETLKGFVKERRWDKVLESLHPGDYVIVEFGTNDSKSSGPQNIYPGQDFSETYAPADTVFKERLRKFVQDVRERKAYPIIVSPCARRAETSAPTSLAAWAKAAMDAAQETGATGIDLNAMGVTLNRALGPDADKLFGDRTHHVEYGSYLVAKCVVLGLQRSGLPIAQAIVPEFNFDPANPAPRVAQFDLPPDLPGHLDAGARDGAPPPSAKK